MILGSLPRKDDEKDVKMSLVVNAPPNSTNASNTIFRGSRMFGSCELALDVLAEHASDET
jgi:hypothetical protein